MFPILNSMVETFLEPVSNQRQNTLFEGIQIKYCAEERTVLLQISPGANGPSQNKPKTLVLSAPCSNQLSCASVPPPQGTSGSMDRVNIVAHTQQQLVLG